MNMPDINKKFVGSSLPIELVAKLRSLAKKLNMSVNAVIEMILSEELKKRVVLTSEDYQWIADEVKKNELQRKFKNKEAKRCKK